MNVPKAIELAMAKTIRNHSEVGQGVTIRSFQNLQADPYWKENPDRSFPMIDVRCGPPQSDDNQSTLRCECAILLGTNGDDDKSHAFLSGMYEAVQGLVDQLFSRFRLGQDDQDPLAFFLDEVENETGEEYFRFGGLTFGEGLSPYDDGGINMIGVTLIVHYSRDDF